MLTLLRAVICFFGLSFASLSAETWLLDSVHEGHKIEIRSEVPDQKNGKLIILLHGAAAEEGAKGLSSTCVNHWLEKGYSVAAISLPGYGKSTGPRDFCGPFTRSSIPHAITAIKAHHQVKSFGLVGFGQGGLAASISAIRGDIDALIIVNSCYDLRFHTDEADPLRKEIEAKSYAFDMDDDMAVKARSPIYYSSCIYAPTAIFHRKDNPLVSTGEMMDFVRGLSIRGIKHQVTLLEQNTTTKSQKIAFEEIVDVADAWIEEHM